MKKLMFVLVALTLLVIPSTAVATGGPNGNGKYGQCTTIQDGEIYTSDGELITPGYNEWGYNYQAHIFNGDYCDYHPVYRPGGAYHDWCIENYGDVDLIMKWNDAWLSNKDCDGDGKLDRHYGYEGYIGSGAWETNHQWGTYVGGDGETCRWDYFVKIVAVPEDAYYDDANNNNEPDDGELWYTADGTEIGPVIWGSFATIQEVYNDPCGGYHGIWYLSPAGPGFGKW